jgi:hypothetical protein
MQRAASCRRDYSSDVVREARSAIVDYNAAQKIALTRAALLAGGNAAISHFMNPITRLSDSRVVSGQ